MSSRGSLTGGKGNLSNSGVGGGKAKSSDKPKTRSSRAGLQFPVGRLHRLLRKGKIGRMFFLCSTFLRAQFESSMRSFSPLKTANFRIHSFQAIIPNESAPARPSM